MAVSKLIVFLAISMAFVLTVRCQQQDEFEYVDAEVQRTDDQGTMNTNTTEPGKKGFANCVKEKVKKVVDKGKQVLKAAGDAISRGYNDFKNKAKEIIGKKQPETAESTPPSGLNPSGPNPSESFPPLSPSQPSPLPSGHQDSRGSQSTTDDQAELIDPRQKFTK